MDMDVTNTNQLNRPAEEQAIMKTDVHQYAGFWMRFWAYLADIVIITSIHRIVIYPIFRFLDVPTENTGLFSAINILTAVVFYLYFVLLTKYFKQTLGKMIFGLKVIPLNKDTLTWDTVIFREWIGRFISASIWVLYAIVAFLPKKQGLHDLFADTAVVHERR